jgi:hypothetical protein
VSPTFADECQACVLGAVATGINVKPEVTDEQAAVVNRRLRRLLSVIDPVAFEFSVPPGKDPIKAFFDEAARRAIRLIDAGEGDTCRIGNTATVAAHKKEYPLMNRVIADHQLSMLDEYCPMAKRFRLFSGTRACAIVDVFNVLVGFRRTVAGILSGVPLEKVPEGIPDPNTATHFSGYVATRVDWPKRCEQLREGSFFHAT